MALNISDAAVAAQNYLMLSIVPAVSQNATDQIAIYATTAILSLVTKVVGEWILSKARKRRERKQQRKANK